MPRARMEDAQSQSREWRSRMIPRYQRRTERVDEAILGSLPERYQYPPAARRTVALCCVARRYQKMPYRAWSGACVKILRLGPSVILAN